MDAPEALLLLPRLRVQNANALSGPLTWGFPAVTAFTGFVQALELKLREALDIQLAGVAIVCHHHQAQTSVPAGKRTRVFHLTRNPVGKDGATAAIVEEGRIHLDVSLLIGVSGTALYDGLLEPAATLGTRLRLHGPAAALDRLLALDWLAGMRDHLHLGALTPVPAQVRWRQVSRVQVDSNPDRLRRRLIKRHGLSEAEARQRIPDSAAKRCALPFVTLRSNGNGQRFLLFIRHGPLLDAPLPGSFNRYGLSTTATVPWF